MKCLRIQRSSRLAIARLLAFGDGAYIETDSLTFGQGLEAVRLDGGKVGKEVFAAHDTPYCAE